MDKEFEQLIEKLEKLSKRGFYFYGMYLLNSFPIRWLTVLIIFDMLNKDYTGCEGLEIDVCLN